ncbi:MAG: hypothetical protein QNJ90_16435 [Planctomycetota bacterium]|nr:hypothetical protein [Planctomycetota bacterium]
MRPLSLLLLLLLPALPVCAEDEVPKPPLPKAAKPDIRAQVAAWLEELKSEEYRVREAARRNLLAKGLQARDLLEAAQDDEDPEVRRTVRAVLARAPARPVSPAAHVRPGDFRGIGRLTVQAEGEPLGEVLARVGAALGGRILPPAGRAEEPLTLSLEDAAAYDVLEAIARATRSRPQQPFDRSGRMTLVAVADAYKPAPRAASGPMQVTLVEVSATRSFGAPAPPRYALKLRLEWAPCVQVRQYERPRIEVARDPDGRRYRPTPAMSRTTSYGVGTTVKSHTTTVHVEPAEADCKEHLAALELSVPVMHLRHDRAVVELPDITKVPLCLGVDGKPAKPGTNESVQFHSIQEVEGGRGQWVVDFTATLTAESAQQTLEAFLVESDGTLRRVNVYGGRSIGADGTVRITARAYRGTSGKPKSLRVSWFRREEQGSIRFRLENVPLR